MFRVVVLEFSGGFGFQGWKGCTRTSDLLRRSMDFCDVLVVNFPGIMDVRVLRALRSLPRRTLIPLLQEPRFL